MIIIFNNVDSTSKIFERISKTVEKSSSWFIPFGSFINQFSFLRRW